MCYEDVHQARMMHNWVQVSRTHTEFLLLASASVNPKQRFNEAKMGLTMMNVAELNGPNNNQCTAWYCM